jgi:hypothetical protein
MSEKERFIKISYEFNKLKAHLEANKFEDYDFCLMVLLYIYFELMIVSSICKDRTLD